jgi:hypothetical protein
MTVQQEPDLAVSVRRCQKVWRSYGYRLQGWLSHGPSGFEFVLGQAKPQGSVIVSQAEFDGVEWIHASLAWNNYTPNYQQLKILHESVFGPTRTAYQAFAATADHVNIHEHALHLWGRADGAPVLPNFGALGTI